MEFTLFIFSLGCAVLAFILITLPVIATNDVFFKPIMILMGLGAALAFIGTVVY